MLSDKRLAFHVYPNRFFTRARAVYKQTNDKGELESGGKKTKNRLQRLRKRVCNCNCGPNLKVFGVFLTAIVATLALFVCNFPQY